MVTGRVRERFLTLSVLYNGDGDGGDGKGEVKLSNSYCSSLHCRGGLKFTLGNRCTLYDVKTVGEDVSYWLLLNNSQ